MKNKWHFPIPVQQSSQILSLPAYTDLIELFNLSYMLKKASVLISEIALSALLLYWSVHMYVSFFRQELFRGICLISFFGEPNLE